MLLRRIDAFIRHSAATGLLSKNSRWRLFSLFCWETTQKSDKDDTSDVYNVDAMVAALPSHIRERIYEIVLEKREHTYAQLEHVWEERRARLHQLQWHCRFVILFGAFWSLPLLLYHAWDIEILWNASRFATLVWLGCGYFLTIREYCKARARDGDRLSQFICLVLPLFFWFIPQTVHGLTLFVHACVLSSVALFTSAWIPISCVSLGFEVYAFLLFENDISCLPSDMQKRARRAHRASTPLK